MNSRPSSAASHRRQGNHRIALVKQYLANEKLNAPRLPIEIKEGKGELLCKMLQTAQTLHALQI